ncbi:UNVERIFIED_CONTAM: NADH-ubiquinone oxidoreductase chain 2, partial [Sesamum angustifolium]
MLHESAAFSVVLSHSCPPRRATRSVVVTQDKHAARLLAGRIEVLFRSTVHPVKCKKHSRITQRTLLVCFLLARKEERQGKPSFCHPLAYWDSTGFACPLQDSGSARESAGNNRKEGVHVAAAPAPFLVNGAQQRALFSLRIPSLSCEFPSGEFKTCGALSIPSLEPRRKPPSPSDSISLLTLYMWAPDIYEGSPTPVTAFLSIAPKISISANISRVSIYGSYGATLQQIFFFCSIASMILGALAAMAQTKVKRLLAHSSIGHVGYIRTGFSCGTIEGIQSLLIGIFIYASMTIDAFAIVSALRQTRVKYIADLGALAKTNPILAITFSITMFSYAGIPPLAGFCSKFYLFFAALGCGAYFLAPVGVVTSVIGRWAAGRLPR